MLDLTTDECRVGVVGVLAAGKTAFLTSLINHLAEHDPAEFRLGRDGKAAVRRFREIDPGPGWERFPYARYRGDFADRRWPKKTTDASEFACEFERSDWSYTARLRLYDLPGERVADAVMAVKDYAGWSDYVLRLFEDDPDYRGLVRDYLELAAAPGANGETLVAAYRAALGRLIMAYKPYVTPSTFLINRKAEVNRRPAESDPAAFPCGLDPARQFVPLPAAARRGRPDLAGPMAAHYAAYAAGVAGPLVGALRSCHALIVLADVTSLLAGGVGFYNDARQLVIDLLEVVSPGDTRLGAAFRGLSYWALPAWLRAGWVAKVAFVAPKLDQVFPGDRDRMVALVREAFERPARDHRGLKTLFTNCSAVKSVREMWVEKGVRWMRAEVKRDHRGGRVPRGEVRRVTVSEVPGAWPPRWAAGDYAFPEVWPEMPPRKHCKPEQVNLDKVFAFVTS